MIDNKDNNQKSEIDKQTFKGSTTSQSLSICKSSSKLNILIKIL